MINYMISGSATLFALASILISLYVYKTTRKDTSYLDIDKQYSELLKIGLNDPDLRDYGITSMFYKLDAGNSFKKKYNIYAYMCWNLVETIYDQQKDKKGRFNKSDSWVPVIFEENRLHYTWFKHNIRLFKPEFQRFVTSDLNDIDIVEGTINDLKDVYDRFKVDFAANEIKDYSHLELLLMKKKYKLLLAKHKVFEKIIGYAFTYEPDDLKVLWLDYMAIDSKFQNAGYGTLLFNKIAESKQEGSLGIFLETEIPEKIVGLKRTDQIRRIKFYERLGAQKINIHYALPTDDGGFPMHLYFRPSSNLQVLPKEIIKETITSAFEYIHSDISKKDIIIKKFLSSVQDEYIHNPLDNTEITPHQRKFIVDK